MSTPTPASVSQVTLPSRALEIMGANVFGSFDVERAFGGLYTESLLEWLLLIPFSEQTLQECRDTHMLFPGFPLTLLEIRSRYHRGVPAFSAKQLFPTTALVEPRWHLIRKGVVPQSAGLPYERQLALLSPREEVPSVGVLAFMAFLHLVRRGEELFHDSFVRVRDPDGAAGTLIAGNFALRLVYVGSDADHAFDPAIGLASARKLDLALPAA